MAYGTLGYVECADGELEAGFEKVAIYADAQFTPTHASRQLADGRWTSKLGKLEDIEHDTIDNVNCPTYGTAVRFMKRPRQP